MEPIENAPEVEDAPELAPLPPGAEEWMGVSVESFLRTLADQLFQQEYNAKFQRDKAAYRSRMFYNGKQRLFEAPSAEGWWRELPRKTGEILWQSNRFKAFTDSNAKEYARSRSEIQAQAASSDEQKVEGARSATALTKHFWEVCLTERALQNEGIALQLDGEGYRVHRWDPNAGPLVAVPRTVVKMVAPPDEFDCPCGKTGLGHELAPVVDGGTDLAAGGPEVDAEDAPPAAPARACPKCGSTEEEGLRIHVHEPEPMTVPTGEVDYVRAGNPAIDWPDIFEMWCNSDARQWDEVYWVRRYRLVDKAVALYNLPQARGLLTQGSILNAEDLGPFYRQRLERTFGGASGGSIGASDADFSTRKVELSEDWFKPSILSEYIATFDQQIPGTSGLEIKRGQRLIDVFKDGCRAIRSGRNMIDVLPANVHDEVVQIQFRPQPGSVHGRGVEDACAPQEQLNEMLSLLMRNILTSSAPILLYLARAFGQTAFTGTPGQVVPVLELPYGTDLKSIIEVIAGTPLPPEVWQMIGTVLDHMQAIFGAYSTYNGEVDPKNTTARGQAIVREQSAAMIGQSLALRSAGDVETARILASLFKDNDKYGRAVKYGGAYADEEWVELKGSDLHEDYTWTAVQGSWLPRQEYEQQANLQDYVAQLTALAGLGPQFLNPAMLNLLARTYNQPPEVNDPLVANQTARKELDALKAKLAEVLGDPETMDAAIEQADLENAQALQYLQARAIQASAMGGPAPEAPETVTPEDVVVRTVLESMPVRRWLDSHALVVAYLQAYANTSKGLAEPREVQLLMQKRIEEHFTVMAKEQAFQAGAQQEAMAPVEDEANARQVITDTARAALSHAVTPPQGGAGQQTCGPVQPEPPRTPTP